MKILYTGGGTGGHFYPIIAVAEELGKLLDEYHYQDVTQYFVSDTPYNQSLLDVQKLTYIPLKTGKVRVYFSLKNIIDKVRIVGAVINSLVMMYKLYPDIVFSKGGYPSFPTVCAAAFFGIPIIIHESDSVPGRANKFAARFAQKIAISYPEAAKYFPEERTALTGNPIRKELLHIERGVGHQELGLDPNLPTLFILGGSQGAQFINDLLLQVLPNLLEKYQVIHQVGKKNIDFFTETSETVISTHPNKDRYHPYSYLSTAQMRAAAGSAHLIISRGGSTIFEIAEWGIPSLIIPITHSNGDHQRKNAFTYSRAGACLVMEEENMTPMLFMTELDNLMADPKTLESMSTAASAFSGDDAAKNIAKQILLVLREHGKNK